MTDLPEDFTTPARVAIGAPYQGTFEVVPDIPGPGGEPTRDTDAIGFVAEAGVTYRLTLDTGEFYLVGGGEQWFREDYDRSGLRSDVYVFPPDNGRVAYGTSETTGTVFVRVNSERGSPIGDHDYTLTIEEVPSDISPFASQAQPFTVGTTITSRNDFAFDADMYEITLKGGQRYEFRTTEEKEHVTNAMRLFRAPEDGSAPHRIDDWIRGESAYQGSDRMIFVTPPEDGTYFLNVSGASAPGSYTLTARETDDLPHDASTAARLAVGETVDGLFDGATEQDAYAIDLLAGVAYDFTLVSGAGVGLRLFGADNRTILSAGKNLTATVSSDGTYYISAQAIFGSFGPIAAQYTLNAEISSDIPGTIDTEARLAVGTPQSDTLYRGDIDWFGVTLDADTTYQLRQEREVRDTTRLSLHDSTGAEITAHTSDHGRPLTFTTTSAGEYFVGIQAAGYEGGDYMLRLDPVVDVGQTMDTAANLPMNTVRHSHLFDGDQDWFNVTPGSDGEVLVMLESTSYGRGPVLGVGDTPLELDSAGHIGVATSVITTTDPFVLTVTDRPGTADFYSLHVAEVRDSGTDGRDALIGTDADDSLHGLANNDTLLGGLGDDLLKGGHGEDRLLGGRGDDWVEGGQGDDHLQGGHGNDLIAGNSGDDFVAGNIGTDTLVGGAGDDFLNGGLNSDALHGRTGADRFYHSGRENARHELIDGIDWIGDYSADEGDVLVIRPGVAEALHFTRDDLGAGDAGVAEIVVSISSLHRPLREVFVLVDGAAEGHITYNLGAGLESFDLSIL